MLSGTQGKLEDGFNPIALRKAKIVYNFGLSECIRVNCNSGRIFIFLKFQVKPVVIYWNGL